MGQGRPIASREKGTGRPQQFGVLVVEISVSRKSHNSDGKAKKKRGEKLIQGAKYTDDFLYVMAFARYQEGKLTSRSSWGA